MSWKKAPAPAALKLGERPTLKWLPLDQLFIDKSYQRSTESRRSQNSIEYLERNFSWGACGALIVALNPKQKKYAVIDGQHRFLAAQKRKDIAELPCLIVGADDFKAQVQNFVIVNTKRVNMHTLSKFHAAAAGGDPDSVSIIELLKECKMEVPKTPQPSGQLGPRQIYAVSTLVGMLDKYSKKQIIWALTIIPEAYGEAKGQMRGLLIKALVEFIKQNPDADRARMIKVLGGVDPFDLEKDAASSVKLNGGNRVSAAVEGLTRLYKNAGRAGAK